MTLNFHVFQIRDSYHRRLLSSSPANGAPAFGTLLTPLVDGIRIQGRFFPAFTDRRPKLVLLDGEGLGHVGVFGAGSPAPLGFRRWSGSVYKPFRTRWTWCPTRRDSSSMTSPGHVLAPGDESGASDDSEAPDFWWAVTDSNRGPAD